MVDCEAVRFDFKDSASAFVGERVVQDAISAHRDIDLVDVRDFLETSAPTLAGGPDVPFVVANVHGD